MIVKMRKLNLVAMSCEKDEVLDALQRTNAVEVKVHAPVEDTDAVPEDGEALRARLSAAESALALLTTATESYAKEFKTKTEGPKDGFEVSYSEFMAAGERRDEAEALIAQINALADEKTRLKAELSKTLRIEETAKPYAAVPLPFSAFCETARTQTRLGLLPAAAGNLLRELEQTPLVALCALPAGGDGYVLSFTCHKSVFAETEKLLIGAGFAPCPFSFEKTGAEYLKELSGEREKLESELRKNASATFALGNRLRLLKVYCDFLLYETEKSELASKLRATATTFLLEAYVPEGTEEEIEAELSKTSRAIYAEFGDVAEDETPPTLTRNNAVVTNFEAITNMYSPPNAREFDPNTVMAFFYSLFMGFIMADWGYGLLMMLGGGILCYKQRARDGGLKRLAGVFAVGGVFAVVWGILFNSLFGIPLLPFTVMPDAQNATWSFLGISIPAVLVIALEIGVLQLCAGYVCRAVQCFRRGQIWDGILDGVVWAVFSVGVGLAIAGLVDEAHCFPLAVGGGITAGVCLVISVLTAGRKEKLLGKFTKGFGAAYGVINYASDILSYARLYGLMLSGAVIAQIISQYAVTGMDGGVGMIASGNAGLVILGVVLMVVGHLFNLALSLLGAYIHDARLQYVEFYGRFFEGEGEPFTPLGSVHRHVWIPPRRIRPNQKTELKQATN